MSNLDELNRVDEIMSDIGYKRIIAVKDHRTVERYEAPGKQLQNVSKQLALLISQYLEQETLKARIDELDKLEKSLVQHIYQEPSYVTRISELQQKLTTNKSKE